MAVIRLSFQTCTTMEAVDEINIVLKNAQYSERVTEDDLVSVIPVDKINCDDFNDNLFIFEINIVDSIEHIKEKLVGSGVGIAFPADEIC